MRRGDRPRPTADRAAPRCPRQGPALDLALPHRPLDARPGPIERLLPMIEEYDASVSHLPTYVPTAMGAAGREGVNIIPPAIDPLSPKNMAFSPEDAAFVSRQFGIDPTGR